MERALDAALANTPISASFPKHNVITVCSYPAICCELGMYDSVHIEGLALWSSVPNDFMESFSTVNPAQQGYTVVAEEETFMREAVVNTMRHTRLENGLVQGKKVIFQQRRVSILHALALTD